MKKIFALLMAVCLMASVCCVTAFAASSVDGDMMNESTLNEGGIIRDKVVDESNVIYVGGLLEDGTVEEIGGDESFADGWNAAVKYAKNGDWLDEKGYERIVVDLRADWTASKGKFGSGDGFSDGAIYVPQNVKLTLNLNGFTISRALTNWKWNGEVICVDNKANFIVNGGTITGGWSGNGAGGIHIYKNAYVTLNDVHIVGNIADDDNGGGIAIHDGSRLTVNGGSFANNAVDGKDSSKFFGGAIYAYNSSVELYGVEIKNNQGKKAACYGAAIYAENSSVWMEECTFDGNGIKDEAKEVYAAFSIVHGVNSGFVVKKTTFSSNGALCYRRTALGNYFLGSERSGLFWLKGSHLVIEDGCSFKSNTVYTLIDVLENSTIYGENSTFTDNTAVVVNSREHTDDSYFKSCTFKNNYFSDTEIYKGDACDFYITDHTFTFYDCYLGDSVFSDTGSVKFDDSEIPNGAQNVGSLFGEGSLPMLLSLLALVSSLASIGVSVMLYKKQTAPAGANREDEE